MELTEPPLKIAEGLKRAFDAYLAHPDPEPAPSPRRGKKPADSAFDRIDRSQRHLGSLISSEIGDISSKIGDGRAPERFPLDDVMELLTSPGPPPDTLALASRIAGYLAGPPVQPWQYVAVSVKPAFSVEMYDGWELAAVDPAGDPALPLRYCNLRFVRPYKPEYYHFNHGYGAIRRASGDHDVPLEESDSAEAVLTLPLLALNLAGDYPVHAGLSYYVEPGRRVSFIRERMERGLDPHAHPKELHQWDYIDVWVRPRQARRLNAAETEHLAKFLPELGARILGLNARQREHLIAAADQYLIVAHRTPGAGKGEPALPTMQNAEAAFRWVSAIEGLLTSTDNDRSDLLRKTAQRAAVLAGQDDAGRVAVYSLVRAAYRLRSAYAHGNHGKAQDATALLRELRPVTRRIITSWTALAAEIPPKELPATLDEALLSSRTLERRVQEPLERFWASTRPERPSS